MILTLQRKLKGWVLMQAFLQLERWTGAGTSHQGHEATSRVEGHVLCKFKIFRPYGRTHREIRKEGNMCITQILSSVNHKNIQF